jgi:methylmalonyl-CoA mutase cobalamin-binding subunit
VRFVTAASLFDGHDAAINIMRRILQSMGAEVIHLGHNRSVDEVVTAACRKTRRALPSAPTRAAMWSTSNTWWICSSNAAAQHIQVFGGGGGVIVPSEIAELQAYGVTRIYSPEDGQRMGLAGMIGEMVMRCDQDLTGYAPRWTPFRGTPRCIGAPWRTHHRSGRLGVEKSFKASLELRAQAATKKDTGSGYYRNRWRGQIVADRRADSPPCAWTRATRCAWRHQH